jgi:hypothetical protein
MRVLLIALVAVFLVARDAAAVIHCPGYAKLKNAYFGDLHVHTAYSLDAYEFGTRTSPASAYAFATGAAVDLAPGPAGYTITSSGGRLDFAAITDHSEWLSSDYGCTAHPTSPFYNSPFCMRVRNGPRPYPYGARPCAGYSDLPGGTGCFAEQTIAWDVEKEATEAANHPCTFTTFHAYEWTLNSPSRVHRNVFFRNANVPALPLDANNYSTAPLLWAGLAAQCNPGTGCEALTIPHNMNESDGRAFTVDGYGPIELNRMTEFQRLAEIHQHKGSSECVTDTADNGAVSACNFEVLPWLANPEDVPGYARSGLKDGVVRAAATRHDPLKFGFVGGTDTHNGTPGAVGEIGWIGQLGADDNSAEYRVRFWPRYNPGGLTGVWAEENTRDSIWAALRRRETFATSGPRIKVRFYAFTDASNPCTDPAFPDQLVRGGAVPMGGTFQSVPGNGAPRFVVYALPAPAPAPDQKELVAVDVVKGSVVAGAATEKVFTIPLSGVPYCVTWTDPGFDPAAPAFYYARVREEPTRRWSQDDCAAFRASTPDWQTYAPACASSDPATGIDHMIQERAWTSSIWHLPGGPLGVPSTLVRMRDGSQTGDPARRRFDFRSTTKAGPGAPRIVRPARMGPGDPTLHGATLTIQNPVESGETVTIPLPAAGWQATSLRYTFAAAAGAPVRAVTVANDRITIGGGGSAWPFTLDEPRQGTIAVRLALGTDSAWCAVAPARATGIPPLTTRNDARDRFNGQPRAPAPDQCPVVGP